MRKWFLLIGFTFGPWLAEVAFCRAGGGHAFSSGHSSYSGGSYGGGYSSGGGGGIDLAWLVIRLIELSFTHPLIGIPIDIGIAWIIFTVMRAKAQIELEHHFDRASPNDGASRHFDIEDTVRTGRVQDLLSQLRATEDPAFSLISFKDFAYSLYAKAQKLRGEKALSLLSPYFSEEAQHQLNAMTPNISGVSGVIVGACEITTVSLEESVNRIHLSFTANYTETVNGSSTSWFSQEKWVLTRKKGVQSKPPEKIKAIQCPNCGAPLENSASGKCGSCGQMVRSGAFDWFVESLQVYRTVKGPDLADLDDNKGFPPPTVYDPELPAQLQRLQKLDPCFQMTAFTDQVAFTFMKIQEAWTTGNWSLARPYETDNVFGTHLYWIEEYKRTGARNVLQNIKIQKIVPVKASQDLYFSSITVRIFASMTDYTEQGGKVISGSPSLVSPFTEYWTFIRSVSPAPKKSEDLRCCPACGAPLKINQAGTCEFCKARIVSGEFNWVLSEIEQDRVYGG